MRLFDLAVAGTALLLTVPLLVVVALAIRIESPGPVLSRQLRLGRNNTRFELLTFRCTKTDTGAITLVGRFLRLASIEDLPQLWNVLRGDMSLVGPRPALPPDGGTRSPGDGTDRVTVVPGLTGLWREADEPQAG